MRLAHEIPAQPGSRPILEVAPCPTCGGRGWQTAGGNDPAACGCPAGEAWVVSSERDREVLDDDDRGPSGICCGAVDHDGPLRPRKPFVKGRANGQVLCRPCWRAVRGNPRPAPSPEVSHGGQ